MFKNIFLLLTFAVFLLNSLYSQQTQVCGQVQDPTGNCPGFEGVEIEIKDSYGNVLCSTMTNANGNYCCQINDSDFPIEVCASADCPFETTDLGVSDLVLIQRFILGFDPPSWMGDTWLPYFSLIADATLDGRVSVTDLVFLRRAILGDLEFPQGYSFCQTAPNDCLDIFGMEYGFPCIGECPTILSASSAGFGHTVNFQLFNIGDANGSNTNCNKAFKSFYNQGINHQVLEQLEKASIDLVKPHNIADTKHLTLGDKTNLKFIALSAKFNRQLTKRDFIINDDRLMWHIEGDILHLAYFSDDQLSQSVNLSDEVIITDLMLGLVDVFDSYAINAENRTYSIEMNLSNDGVEESTLVESPFSIYYTNDHLHIISAIESDIIVNLYDLNGRLVLANNTHIGKGNNQISLSQSSFFSGMFFVNIFDIQRQTMESSKLIITR